MSIPTGLANLLFWYKADAITGLTDGASLTSWPDSGPNGWHITTIAGTAPTWRTNIKNGLPAVLFGGAGLLELPAAALAAFQNKGAGTVYVVINETSAAGGAVQILRASAATAGPGRFAWAHTSSQLQLGGRRLDADTFVSFNDQAFATSTWYVENGSIDWTNNVGVARQSGGTPTTHASMFASGGGSSQNAASAVIDVGGNSSSSSQYLTGYIAEIFAFDRILTTSEQQQMDSYCSDRYGITVGDYVASGVPGAPTAASAAAGNTQATVTFTAPAAAAITGYTATSNPGSFTGSISGATAAPITVTGLTNGQAYTFTVHATNAVGNSSESAASNSVTPTAVPGAPTAVTPTPGNAQVALAWTAPASDGGSALTDYTVQYSSNGGSTWSTFAHGASTATSITVTGLTNATAYVFHVAAVNANGAGSYSSTSASVTPTASTAAPTCSAGSPQTLHSRDAATLAGSVTWAAGHTGTVAWTPVTSSAGPVTAGATTLSATVGDIGWTALSTGGTPTDDTITYQLTVTQDDAQTASSTVVVTRLAAGRWMIKGGLFVGLKPLAHS